MNRNSARLSLYLTLLSVITVAAVVLRTLACVRDLESNMIYYSSGALITAANVVITAGVVLMLTSLVSLRKEPIRATFSSPLTYVPTGVIATALLLFLIRVLNSFGEVNTLINATPGSAGAPLQFCKYLLLACLLLVPVAIAHFFFTAFLTERHERLRGWFALGTILLFAAYAAYLYFNTDAPLNSQNKVVEQMAFLFAALFFLYEARISLGREMWRPYAAFGLSAAALCAYASVPALLAYLINGRIVTESIESAVLLFALFIFIFARLCMCAASSPDRECEEMTALRCFAERRCAALSTEVIEDGTQISIEDLIDLGPTDEPHDDDGEAAEEELLPVETPEIDATTIDGAITE